MWRRKPDRLLEEMIRDNDFAGQEADDLSLFDLPNLASLEKIGG